MLLINERPYTVTEEDKNWDTKNKCPKNPEKPYFDPENGAVFNLSDQHIHKTRPSAIEKNRGKRMRQRQSPRSFRVDTQYTVYDEEGNALAYHYYKTKSEKTNGNMVAVNYQPLYIIFEQSGVLRVRDAELWWYMVNHPRQASSPFKDETRKANFFFENKGQEARRNKARKSTLMEALRLLYGNDDEALDREGLLEMARFYGITGGDRKTDDEFRQELETFAYKHPKEFINVLNNPVAQCIVSIKKCKEAKIVNYNGATRTWSFMSGDKVGDKIHVVKKSSSKDPISLLAEWMVKHDRKQNYEAMMDALEKKEQLAEEEVE